MLPSTASTDTMRMSTPVLAGSRKPPFKKATREEELMPLAERKPMYCASPGWLATATRDCVRSVICEGEGGGREGVSVEEVRRHERGREGKMKGEKCKRESAQQGGQKGGAPLVSVTHHVVGAAVGAHALAAVGANVGGLGGKGSAGRLEAHALLSLVAVAVAIAPGERGRGSARVSGAREGAPETPEAKRSVARPRATLGGNALVGAGCPGAGNQRRSADRQQGGGHRG